jgi:hypothetical protein
MFDVKSRVRRAICGLSKVAAHTANTAAGQWIGDSGGHK